MARLNRSHVLRWVLVGIGGLLVVAGVASGAYVYSLANTFDSSRHTLADAFPDQRAPVAAGKAARAVNILLLGQDVDAVDPENPQFVGKREADAIMVVHVPADRKRIYVLSVLRNSLVDVPGRGKQAINSAVAFGGMPLQVQTVEQLLGVRMDHVVSVSLAGMKDLTDALGGVTVQNPKAFSSKGFSFEPGRQRLSGAEANAYIRGGSNSAASDAARARAQAAYFRGLLNDVLRAKTLLDPTALLTAVSVISPYVTTDKGFDSAYVADLGLSLRGLRADDVTMLSLPAPKFAALGRAKVLEIDRSALAAVRAALKADTLDQYVP